MNRNEHASIWTEIAAAALVPAGAFGFSRVFADMSSLIPIVGAALLSSAIAIVCRRLRLPLVAAAGVSFGLLALLIINRYAADTALLGIIPSGDTLTSLQDLVDELIFSFNEQKSPVQPIPAFIAAALIGAWTMAFLTDWGAMRLRLAFEPVFPSAVLFVFTAIPPISAESNRVISTLVYATAVAAWAISQRIYKLMEQKLWLPNHEVRGPATLARIAAAVSLAAILTGTFVGQRLPWVDDEPIKAFSERQIENRKVTSPFVQISKRLVEETDQDMFTVEAAERSYWRIAGLDEYTRDRDTDGNEKDTWSWKVSADFKPEDGNLEDQDLGGERTELLQTISINDGFGAIWVPAAYPPTKIVESSADLTWNGESSTLTVSRDVTESDGINYTIISEIPTSLSVDTLRSTSPEFSDDIAERYLATDGITSIVRETAAQITAGQETRYDQMIALQQHFRDYEYSVNLGPRGEDPIATFLAERKGFCQQFSGTFALMARALGAPARVATGFTSGDEGTSAAGNRMFNVTGRDAHAWPEIYFEEYGWVPFEPTPGRVLPGAATQYTAIDEEQNFVEDEPVTEPEPTPAEQQAAPAANPELEPEPDGDVPAEGETETDSGRSIFDLLMVPLGLLFKFRYWLILPALATIYAAGMIAYWRIRWDRRRRACSTPAQSVAASWDEACESLSFGLDLDRKPAETRTEYAGRLVDDEVVGATDMRELSELSTVARFNPAGVSESEGQTAQTLAALVDNAVNEVVPVWVRVRNRLDPRRVITLSSAVRVTDEFRQRTGETPTDDLVELSD